MGILNKINYSIADFFLILIDLIYGIVLIFLIHNFAHAHAYLRELTNSNDSSDSITKQLKFV